MIVKVIAITNLRKIFFKKLPTEDDILQKTMTLNLEHKTMPNCQTKTFESLKNESCVVIWDEGGGGKIVCCHVYTKNQTEIVFWRKP